MLSRMLIMMLRYAQLYLKRVSLIQRPPVTGRYTSFKGYSLLRLPLEVAAALVSEATVVRHLPRLGLCRLSLPRNLFRLLLVLPALLSSGPVCHTPRSSATATEPTRAD